MVNENLGDYRFPTDKCIHRYDTNQASGGGMDIHPQRLAIVIN